MQRRIQNKLAIQSSTLVDPGRRRFFGYGFSALGACCVLGLGGWSEVKNSTPVNDRTGITVDATHLRIGMPEIPGADAG